MGRIELGSFKMEWGSTQQKGEGYTYDLKGTRVDPTNWGYSDNFSEEVVTERRAIGLAPVWTCLNVRSRTIASLPINPIIEENGTKRTLTDHPVYYPLSQQFNSWMSSAQGFLTSMIHSDGWGNSIIGISRDSRYKPTSFDVIEPGEWDVIKREGELWYKINGEVYPSSEVLHFRWFSLDGYTGLSPITQNRITMGKMFKQERYSSTALGDRPPGFLSYEGNLTPAQLAQNQKSWKEDRAAGRIPVMSGKWDYETTLIPPGDAEYIETAGLTERQIYGIYQMPPSFAQNYDRMTWSNSEQADLTYAKHTIAPIVRLMEQEMNMKLFTEKEKKNMFVKFNMNGLLRGDSKARAEFYTAMRNGGFMNADEVRSLEDMNKYPGGDIYTVQAASIPVDQLREFYTNKVVPTQPNGKANGKKYEFQEN